MDFLTSPLSSDPDKAGVSQALWGTFWIGVIVVVVAFPLGIATAVYLEEYAAGSRLTRLVDINIRNLAGVPSIVYGLLGPRGVRGAVQGTRCRQRPQRHRGRPDGRGAGAAHRHHHRRGGAPRGAHRHPRGGLRRGCVALAGDLAAGAPSGVPGHPHGHRAVALASPRRDRAAHPGGRRPGLVLQRQRRPGRPARWDPIRRCPSWCTAGPRCPRRSSGSWPPRA